MSCVPGVEPVPAPNAVSDIEHAYRATCSCGWAGPTRPRSEAQAEGIQHVTGEPVRKKPKVQRPTGFFS